MDYQEYKPSPALAAYIQCYYVSRSDADTLFLDKAFATGCMEVMFHLHGSPWQTGKDGTFTSTAPVEVWGQIIEPLPFRLSGKSQVFGIRFYPVTAACFLGAEVDLLNDQVISAADVMGKAILELQERLQNESSIPAQIALVETFLLQLLQARSRILDKVGLLQNALYEMTRPGHYLSMEQIAFQYGISARYLQKLFVRHTGISPRLLARVHRFQQSMTLLGIGADSLTAIAYQCGYFDQSHFIREFREFTGGTPSDFSRMDTTAFLAGPNQ